MAANAAQTVVTLRTGAHLYGTATAESDVDTKSVLLPSARKILLQQVRPGIATKRLSARGE